MTVFRPKPVPVTVEAVSTGRVESLVVNSKAGTVKTRLRAQLSPGINGLVTALTVKKGDRVVAGQLLLQLDADEYKARVEEAARAHDAARAAQAQAAFTLTQAERDLGRRRQLYERGVVPRAELDQYQTHRDVAASDLAAAVERVRQTSAALETQRAILAKCTLTAPFDGVVADLTTEVGEWLSPSPPGVLIPPVIDLFDPDSIYVSAPLDEIDLARVRPGLPVRITIDAYPDSYFMGHVTRIAPYVSDLEEQNRTFEVEASFDDRDQSLLFRPGTTADVEIILEAREGVLRVPTYIILEEKGEKKVLVLRGNRLVAAPVTIGLKNWQFTEILSGLKEGERVVTSLDRAEVKAGARAVVSDDEPAR